MYYLLPLNVSLNNWKFFCIKVTVGKLVYIAVLSTHHTFTGVKMHSKRLISNHIAFLAELQSHLSKSSWALIMT